MAQSIRQTELFDAKPEQVFEALMDSRQHAAFTGAPARISRKVGGAVSAYGTYVAGYNVHIVQDKAIVQAWRASDWPTDAWSVASFVLQPAAGGKTKLTFEQHGVPNKAAKGMIAGWKAAYWEPLRKMLKGGTGAGVKTGKRKTAAPAVSVRRKARA